MPESNRIRIQAYETGGLIIVYIIACIVILSTASNNDVFIGMNAFFSNIEGDIWAHLTILGDALLAGIILFPLFRKYPELIYSAIIAGIIAFGISHGLKTGLNLARPPGVLDANAFHLVGPKLSHKSFPSGHTTAIFTIMTLLYFHFQNKWLRYSVHIFALIIGLSRIAVGVHWPLDVCAGAILGMSSAFIGILISRKLNIPDQRYGKFALAMLFLTGGTILLFFHDTRYDQTKLFQIIFSIFFMIWGVFEFIKLLNLEFFHARKKPVEPRS